MKVNQTDSDRIEQIKENQTESYRLFTLVWRYTPTCTLINEEQLNLFSKSNELNGIKELLTD